jgi:integrase
LPAFVVDALKTHKEFQDCLKKSPNWKEHGLVFTTNIGTPISPRNLLRDFKKKLNSAGLPDIRFHELRHSVASILLAQNKHPKVVQELLGHSTITVTSNTNSHIIPSLQRDVANALDDLLSVPTGMDTVD